MKKPLWVVQENLNNDDKQLLIPFALYDIPYKFITVIPFSDSIPDVDYDGPIILRGSTTTIKNAYAKNWKPGIWHGPNFRPSVYLEKYGEHYHNQGYVTTLKELKIEIPTFVKPNSDFKEFTGGVMTPREVNKLQKGVGMGGYPFDSSLELFVAEKKTLVDEYRFIVVDGKVISGYSYRLNRSLRYLPVPIPMMEKAQEIASIWGPAEVYALDLGVSKDGSVKVVECNCFNGSGLYGDQKTIVRKVNDFVAERYGLLL